MKNLKRYLIITITAIAIMILTLGTVTDFHRPYERPIEIQEWMTQPFFDSLDEPLVIEDWMTKPFITFNS